MSLSNVAFVRSTIFLLLAGFVVLLLIVGGILWLAFDADRVTAEVTRGRQLQRQLATVLSRLQDAETGQRGFLLTLDPAYRTPYNAARASLDGDLTAMKGLLDTDDERRSVMRLDVVVHDKMAELAETLALADSGRRGGALEIVRTDRGKVLMDEARTLLGSLSGRVEERLARRLRIQRESLHALQWAVVAGAIMIVVVIGGSTLTTLSYTRELTRARTELAALNVGLEERVGERTLALTRANDEIQRFAYVVSHDLRSPLVNVIGYSGELATLRSEMFERLDAVRTAAGQEATADDARLAADFNEALGFMQSSITKMDGLINAILKLAREGERRLSPAETDLTALIGRVSADIRHRLDEHGGTVTIGGTAPRIVSDRLALEQVFGNLLDNAVKYRSPDRPPRIAVTSRRDGDSVVVTVEDNGRGIAPEDRERVFELFRRAGSREAPGEGIGLAHVRALVRRIGGDIELSSVLGQGSSFAVTLPLRMRADA